MHKWAALTLLILINMKSIWIIDIRKNFDWLDVCKEIGGEECYL